MQAGSKKKVSLFVHFSSFGLITYRRTQAQSTTISTDFPVAASMHSKFEFAHSAFPAIMHKIQTLSIYIVRVNR